MIPKSGYRFSDKIMLRPKKGYGVIRSVEDHAVAFAVAPV
jgi:hypothetical protein